MPLDPRIPLGVQSAPIESPVQAQGQVMSLQNAVLGHQIQQQQLQAAQLENQQKQLDFEDQQKLRQAYIDASGNLDKTQELAMKSGVGPRSLMALRQQAIEMRSKFLAQTEQEQKISAANAEALSREANSLLQIKDPAQRAAALPDALHRLVSDGHMTADQASQYVQAAASGQFPLDDQSLQTLVAHGMSVKDLASVENQKKTAQGSLLRGQAAADNAARAKFENSKKDIASRLYNAGSQDAYTAIRDAVTDPELKKAIPAVMPADKDQILQIGMSPPEIVSANAKKATEQATANREDRMARQFEQSNAISRARLGIEAQNTAMKRQQFEEDEGAMQRAAQALASGDLTRIQDIASLRSDQRIKLFDMAKKLNPNFNMAAVQRKINTEGYYYDASKKGAQQLKSFGTFLEHAGSASDAVNQIRLSSMPIINKPLNWWREHMSGDPKYTALESSLEPVRKELESFLLGGHALQATDRAAAEKILSPNSSPAQIQEALKTMGHTATARLNQENASYKRVMGRDLHDALDEAALSGAQKIGAKLPAWVNPSTTPAVNSTAPQLPAGGGKQLTDKSIATQFYQAAGGDPKKAADLARKNGWVIQ